MKKIVLTIIALFLLEAGLLAQNYALDFDGTNDYVSTPIDADLQAMPSTTWSGWIKPTGVSGWQIIFGMEDAGWDRFLIIENGGLGLSMGHTNNRWATGASVTAGVWQHVVVVYDNGAMRFYFNGTAYATSTTEGNHSSAGTFTIGGNQSHAPANYYRGLIDEVAVWNEALTAAEITTLYNSGSGLDAASNSGNYTSSSNLVGYYKMNEGTGTTTTDASGNTNTATLNNMDSSTDWVTGYAIQDNTAPTGSLTYSISGTTASSVSENDVVTITATFNENIADSPVMQISGSGVATISATNMTKVSANSYTYAWTVGTGAGTQTFALATGTDIAGNVVTATPTSGASITVDNTFDLGNLGTLVAWYDGNDPHGTGSVSAGDKIATWVDKSANNIHVTQVDASRRPIVVAEGSKYAIQFDGTDMLSVDNAIIEQAFTEYTFISVVKSSVSGYKNIMGRNYSIWEYQWHGQSKINMYINSQEQDGVTGTYPFDGQARIGIFRYHDANNNLDQWIDGTSKSTTNYNKSIPNSQNNFYIGSRMGTAEFFKGEMLELIIFSEYLTDANRERVEDYLANKWGLNGPDLSPESGESFPETTSPTASFAYSVGGTTVSSVSANDVVTITATFNESIADIPVMQISGSGVATISVTNMTKVSANSYTYAWTVGTGAGTQTFALATGTDTAGNVVTATPTSGASITVVDNNSPTVSSFLLSDSALKAGETATVTLTFSEAVAGFSNADITVVNGILSTMTTGDNTTWTGTFTPSINIEDATNILTLSTSYTDVAGNAGPSATTSNYEVDTLLPTVSSFVLSDSALKAGETATVTLTFSEAVAGFSNADITVVNGILSTMTTGNNIIWTGTFTPSINIEDATNILTLSTSYTDVAGNAGPSATTSNYEVDTLLPTVSSFVLSDSALKAGETATVTLTFSEAVAGFSNADITVQNGSLTTLTSDDNITWTGLFTPTVDIEDETNILTLSTNYTDAAGNTGPSATTSNYAIDTSLPTAAITYNSASPYRNGETVIITATFTEAFRKEVLPEQNMLDYVNTGSYSTTGGEGAWQEFTATQTGILTKIVLYQRSPLQTPSTTFEVGMSVFQGVTSTNGSSLSGGTLIGTTSTLLPADSTINLREYVFASPISVTANTKYWFKINNISSGAYYSSLGLNLTDVYANNTTWVGGYNRDLLFKVFFNPLSAAGVADSPVPQIVITGSGIANVTATNMTKTSTTIYTYSYVVPSGDGTATISISNGTDLAGNAITSTPTSGATFIVDNTLPTASLAYSISGSAASSVSENDVVTITATFNENIADSPVVQISGSGVATISATNMTKVSANSYTYAWTVGTGAGTQTFALATGADTAGNVVTATPTSGASITVVDNTSPTVSSFLLSDSALKAGETATVTLTFSEAVAGFSNADITVVNGILSTMTTGNNTTWTGTFTPSINIEDATNILTLSTSYTDVAGNAGPSATTSNYEVDTLLPTVSSFVLSDSALKAGETATVTLTFSEAVAGFSNADITVVNGILSTMTTGNNIIWTGTFTPSINIENATNILTLSTSYTDVAGNAGPSATTSNYEVDTLLPTISSFVLSDSALKAGETATVTLTFSEAVAGFSNADITVQNGSLTTLTSDDNITWTGLFTPTVDIEDETNILTLSTNYTDAAGNTGPSATTSNYAIDTSLPTAAITYNSASPYRNGETVIITATFTEAFRKEVLPEQNMLDYVNTGSYSTTGGEGAWQEFTATQTGILTKIVLYQRNPLQTPSTTFEVGMSVFQGVTSTNGSSLSGGTLIGTTSTLLPADSTINLREYVFASPISVTANTKYWFKINNISSGAYYSSLGLNLTDVYANNTTWVGGYNRDLLFKVFFNPLSAAGVADSPVPQIVITGSGIANVTATNMTKTSTTIYTYSYVVPSGDGTATISISNGTDLAGNAITSTPTSGATFIVDNTLPTASLAYSISGSAASSVSENDVVTITATFNENIADSPVVQISGSGVATISATNMTKVSANSYTYAWTVGTGAGTQTFALATGADTAGNVVTATPTSGASITVVDNTSPTVSSFLLSDSALKAGETATVTLTFSEAVAGFSNADITVVNGILSTMTTGNNTTWTGTFTPSINIEDATNILTLSTSYTDVAGNAGPSATTSNYEVDTLLPTVSSFVLSDSALKAGETATVTLTFSEAVAGFSNADITVVNGILSTMTTGNNIIWTGTFTPSINIENATNILTLSTSYTDVAGNAGPSATTSNYEVDTLLPTISSFVLSDSALKAGETATVTLTFSEAVAGFSNADITVQNGSLTTLTSDDNITWTGLFTPTVDIEDETNILTLSTNYTDAAGNTGPSATTSNYAIDTSLPTAAITYNSASPYRNGETVIITATFTEAMADSPVPQIVITGSGIANVTATNMTKTSTTIYTYGYVVPTGDGTATISISNGTDLAGNAITSTPTSGATFMVDNTLPTASLAYSISGSAASSVSANDVVTITATFNENIADSPVVQISGSGVATISATNMTKVSANSYTYAWTVGTGAGTQKFALATGADIAGNIVTATPTSGFTIVIDAPQHLTKYGKISIASDDLVNKYGGLGGSSGLTANGKRISISPPLDGLTSATASRSAYQIKQDFPGSTDGLYWIANSNINSGTPFQIYADMTTDGGGWTLIMTNAASSGWTYANAIERNTGTPSITASYSIIAWADYIKRSASGFQYMIDATTRGSFGAIWTANGNYSFVNNNNTQTNITINTKFGTWNYVNDNGISERMPWYRNASNGIITTDNGGGSWWGTLITNGGWTPAPWISDAGGGTANPYPGIIWYWVR